MAGSSVESYPKLTAAEAEALEGLSRNLDINASVLWLIINYESGWDPLARHPTEGNRGLLQFTHTSARWLGFADADDLVRQHSTRLDQLLFPVQKYLFRFAPFPTDQSLFLSVFYPVAREWDLDRQFPSWVPDKNPGIYTPRDYINRVYTHSAQEGTLPGGLEDARSIIAGVGPLVVFGLFVSALVVYTLTKGVRDA